MIKDAIRQKYSEFAVSPEEKFAYPTGKAGAEALGYDPVVINEVPAALLKTFCGVGNPFSLGVMCLMLGAAQDLIFTLQNV